MSAVHPDERYAVTIRKAQESVAKLDRMAQDTGAENAELIRRIDAIERTIAQIKVRVDALDALADVVIDQPILYELPEAA